MSEDREGGAALFPVLHHRRLRMRLRDEGTYVCVCEWMGERMGEGGGVTVHSVCVSESSMQRVEMVHTEKKTGLTLPELGLQRLLLAVQ